MRISDWSSDVCSSDLPDALIGISGRARALHRIAHGRALPEPELLKLRVGHAFHPLHDLARMLADHLLSSAQSGVLGCGASEGRVSLRISVGILAVSLPEIAMSQSLDSPTARSEERRVGYGVVSKCHFRW